MTGLLWAVWIIVGLLIYISILLTIKFNNEVYYTQDLIWINGVLNKIKDSNRDELKSLYGIILDNGKTLIEIKQKMRL